jgi:hypothetical protein
VLRNILCLPQKLLSDLIDLKEVEPLLKQVYNMMILDSVHLEHCITVPNYNVIQNAVAQESFVT